MPFFVVFCCSEGVCLWFFLIWGYGSTEDFCFVSTINPTSTILLLQINYVYLYLCVCHVPMPPCQCEGQSGTQFSCSTIEILGTGLRNPAVSRLTDPSVILTAHRKLGKCNFDNMAICSHMLPVSSDNIVTL